MKHLYIFITFFISIYSYTQFAINNISPQVTLDVSGKATDSSISDGIKAPIISLNQLIEKKDLYIPKHKGLIVYINEVSTNYAIATDDKLTSLRLISLPGYYYFDGSVWKSLEPRVGAVMFNGLLGKGSHSNGNDVHDTVSSGNLKIIKLEEEINIGGDDGDDDDNNDAWDSTNYVYTIPITGTYLFGGSIRRIDNHIFSASIYLKVGDFSTGLTPDGIWVSNRTSGRFTVPYSRIAFMKKGDKVSLCLFQDGGSDLSLLYASMSITLLNQTEN